MLGGVSTAGDGTYLGNYFPALLRVGADTGNFVGTSTDAKQEWVPTLPVTCENAGSGAALNGQYTTFASVIVVDSKVG